MIKKKYFRVLGYLNCGVNLRTSQKTSSVVVTLTRSKLTKVLSTEPDQSRFLLNELSLKSRDIFPKNPKITTPLSCSKQ